jgi:hypothetical protein
MIVVDNIDLKYLLLFIIVCTGKHVWKEFKGNGKQQFHERNNYKYGKWDQSEEVASGAY